MAPAFRRVATSLAMFVCACQRGEASANGTTGTSQGSADSFELVVVSTTDVHGRLRGWDYYRDGPDSTHSLAAAATIADSIRTAHPDGVLLVDAGDFLQGNPLTYVAARVANPAVHPVMAAMNAMQYDAAVIGNHEFNYGVPHLEKSIAAAKFPLLAANVHDSTGKLRYGSVVMVERHGVKIGVIGATTPGSMLWDHENLRAAGLTISDIVPAVRAGVQEAKQRKADVIVVLLHSGLDEPASYDTIATGLPSENVAARVAHDVPGVDLIVYGHSHSQMADTSINNVLLVQPKNWATSVGASTLKLAQDGGRWRVTDKHSVLLPVVHHAESKEVLAATDAVHNAAVTWANASVGRTSVAWRSDSARVADVPIIDFVLEVMRRETKAELAAASAFSLDASLVPGPITRAQLSKLYPYDNTLRAVRISGAQLRAFLDYSSRYYRTLGENGAVPPGGLIDTSVPGYNFDIVAGADYTIDLRRPLGSRVTSLMVHGRPVVDRDTFTIALNNYRQGGGGGFAMLAGAPVVYSRDVEIRQLLMEEASRVGTLDPARYAHHNWQLLPREAVAIAFQEQQRERGRSR